MSSLFDRMRRVSRMGDDAPVNLDDDLDSVDSEAVAALSNAGGAGRRDRDAADASKRQSTFAGAAQSIFGFGGRRPSGHVPHSGDSDKSSERDTDSRVDAHSMGSREDLASEDGVSIAESQDDTVSMQHHEDAKNEKRPIDLSGLEAMRNSRLPLTSKDEELVAALPKSFFTENFDPVELMLQSLPDTLEAAELDSDRKRQWRILQSISKRLSQLVLDNHKSFVQELTRVAELQEELEITKVVCKNGRRHLQKAEEGVNKGGLQILAHTRKRQTLAVLLQCLKGIQTIQRSHEELRRLLDEGNFPKAIDLCVRCQKAANAYKQLNCVREMGGKLQETFELIEDHLDGALKQMCVSFNPAQYELVLTAYELLGRGQRAMDQLHMHFTTAIDGVTHEIVLRHVRDSLPKGIIPPKPLAKMQFQELCGMLDSSRVVTCLADLCRGLCDVMRSHRDLAGWHTRRFTEMEREIAQHSVTGGFGSPAKRTSADLQQLGDVKMKLEHGRKTIWEDIQRKVALFLIPKTLAAFKFDEFIRVLNMVNSMIAVGDEFDGEKSRSLREALKQKTATYFKSFHRFQMENLLAMLENEAWQRCPVSARFSIYRLKEFLFMRREQGGVRAAAVAASGKVAVDQLDQARVLASKFFERYGASGEHPYDALVRSLGADIAAASEFDGDDGAGDDDDSLGPMLTTTTLNYVRLMGRYVHMMDALKPIALDVVIAIAEIFDYYLYAVFRFFGSPGSSLIAGGDDAMMVTQDPALPARLRPTLLRLHEGIGRFAQRQELANQANIRSNPNDASVGLTGFPLPKLSAMVDLTHSDSLFGLGERVTATESLLFLYDVLHSLKPKLQSMVPSANVPVLDRFFTETVDIVPELRVYMYRNISQKVINFEKVMQQMALAKWEIKEIPTQHSAYIETLLLNFQTIESKLTSMGRVRVPPAPYKMLWEQMVLRSFDMFVEGYSQVKKCNNEGRALMMLDFQSFERRLEKITTVKPLPKGEIVRNFVSAYYNDENHMESWVREFGRDYTAKQLTGLIAQHPKSKVLKTKLFPVIEDIERAREADRQRR
eukprot:Opistho-2@35159